VVLVGVLDGTVHAVDAASGVERWVFDSGSPLVASNTGSPFFPGAEGSLYHYNEDDKQLEVRARGWRAVAPRTLTRASR